MKNTSRYLEDLKKKYLALRLGELLLASLAAAAVVLCVTIAGGMGESLRALLPALAGCLAFTIGFFKSGLHHLKKKQLVSFINQRYPAMQHSADLLVMDPAAMTTLQQMQQQKIQEAFRALYPSVTFPHQIEKAAILFAISLLMVFFTYRSSHTQKTLSPKEKMALTEARSSLPPSVTAINIEVDPPPYTGSPGFETDEPDLTLPEGSTVSWHIAFSATISRAWLSFSNGDSVALTGNQQTPKKRFTTSTIYQVFWETGAGERKSSDYYKIATIPDQSPKIHVRDQPQFLTVDTDDQLTFDLRADLSDDYGLRDAHIIATVSKGSGEAVKFREEKISFTSPKRIQGRNVKAMARIDLPALGLEPGDELYFYVEAIDNKPPSGNRARTETFFVALQDTASQNVATVAGMSAEVMPEYFRSQRQIIIDSEKLLKEIKTISRQTFTSKSNALAHDQKILRLKYGEFLGEESESGIGQPEGSTEENHQPADGEEDDDPLAAYRHDHDTDNEGHAVPENNPQAHDHGTSAQPGENEDPLAPYKHDHDNAEEATFFTQSIRAKLKAALSAMWDAELHLRMADPKKSLPHQYTALKLLKEISNASRIYVHKTGFDAPPLKEEKRLSGDLTAIRNSRHREDTEAREDYPSIRHAIGVIEENVHKSEIILSAEHREALAEAGQELAVLALQKPGKYLHALSQIRLLQENAPREQVRHSLLYVRKVFWSVLPQQSPSPASVARARHLLDHTFMQKLESQRE